MTSEVQFLDFFARHQASRAPLVMVTVIETSGSTYSKAGHRILIDADGQYEGLVSGGCLEGDLVEHARSVLQTGQPQFVTYDLRGEDDALWGLGLGCGGMMRLLLQSVDAIHDYAPLRLIARVLDGRAGGELIIVTQSDHPDLPSGTVFPQHESEPDDTPGICLLRKALRETSDKTSRATPAFERVSPSVARFTTVVGEFTVHGLEQRLTPIPTILVLGAGPDAVPVVNGFHSLGWKVVLADHRQQYLDREEFGSARRLHWPTEAVIRAGLPNIPADAAVIMTHNLEADGRYLRLLADRDLAYIGLLGPTERRAKVLQSLDPASRAKIDGLLHGPAGLPIGADSPGSIAVSIVAEVYLKLRSSHTDRSRSPLLEPVAQR